LSINARRGLGEASGEGLFLRSLSTLALAVLAAEDLDTTSGPQAGIRAALRSLRAEAQ